METKGINYIIDSIKNKYSKHEFIGLCEISDEEYTQLIEYVGNKCALYIEKKQRVSESDYYSIYLALIEITKKWKDYNTSNETDEADNSFWCYVQRTLTGEKEVNSKLYHLFSDIIKHQSGEQFVNCGHKYYATLMMLSLSPTDSLFSFFNLCYNCFKEDFDYGFTSEDEKYCITIAEEIRKVFENNYREEKTVSIGSSVFSIKIGLRMLATQDNMWDIYLKLITDTFTSINKLFNREILTEDNRLSTLMKKWWSGVCRFEKSNQNTTTKRRVPTVSKQNITIKFTQEEGNVILRLPEIRLEQQDSTVFIKLYNNDIPIIEERLWTRRRELVTTTKSLNWNIDELLKGSDIINLRAIITENDTVIFDSNINNTKSLKREFLLFDNYNEIRNQFVNAGNHYIYSLDIDSLEITSDITRVNKNLFCISSNPGEHVIGIRRKVSFTDEESSTKIGSEICIIGQYKMVEWRQEDASYEVYSKGVKLLIPKKILLKPLDLQINDQTYSLSELEFENADEEFYQFGLRVLNIIEDYIPTKITLYSYEKKSAIFSVNAIAIPDLNIDYDKPLYYNDTIGNVKVIDKVIEFSGNDRNVDVAICQGSLSIEIPRIKWRITNQEWRYKGDSTVKWYQSELTQSDLLTIQLPHQTNNIELYARINNRDYSVTKTHKGLFEVGRFIYAQQSQPKITIECRVGEDIFLLFVVATKEQIYRCPIEYTNGRLFWDIENSFIGSKDRKFFLELRSGKEKIRKEMPNENCEITNINEAKYNLSVKINEDNPFYAEHYTPEPIYKDKITVGKKEKFRFVNKIIYIKSIKCYDKEWHTPKYKYYIKNIKLIDIDGVSDILGDMFYRGELCYKDRNDNEIVIGLMKDECNEYVEMNPVRIEIIGHNMLGIVASWQEDGDLTNPYYNKTLQEICNIGKEDKYYSGINICRYYEEDELF